MRSFICLVIILCKVQFGMAQKIEFPNDFVLGQTYFPGLKETVISPKVIKETGLKAAKGVLENKEIIKNIADIPSTDNVVQAYYEIYQGKKNDRDDAGMIVIEFTSAEAVSEMVPRLRIQSNLINLYKDRFIIIAWSDEGMNSETTLQRISKHFTKKIQAIEIMEIATVAEPQVTLQSTQTVKSNDAANDEKWLTESDLEQMAYSYMQNEEYDKAILYYEKVLEKNKKNSFAYFNICWIYTTTEAYSSAIKTATTALKFVSQENQYKFYRIKGNCYTELDSLSLGAQNFKEAMKRNDNDYLTVYNYGFNRFKAKDFDIAISLLSRALYLGDVEERNVSDIYFYIGTLYSEMGNPAQSLPYFDSAIQESTFFSYYFNKAEAYSRLKQYDNAIEVCNEGLRQNPANAQLFFKRHQMYKNLGENEKSKQSLLQAYQLDDKDPDILLDMGVALGDDNRTEEALKVYRRALFFSNDKGPIYSNMASLFADNKITIDSAIIYHKKAIAEVPDKFIPYLNYGNTLKDLDKYDDAIAMYQKSYQLNNENDVVYGNMAVVYMQKEQPKKAKEWLEKGLKKFPSDFEMNLLSARIALMDKDYKSSERLATTALNNLKAGKSKITALSIRANARQFNQKYQDAIADYLEITNSLNDESKKQNADIFSNIAFCYLYQKEYANAEKYFLECLQYDEEIDALLGMLFVKYYTQDNDGVKLYKKKAQKKYPSLKSGAIGLKKLEEEGYHYSKEEHEIVEQIFGK